MTTDVLDILIVGGGPAGTAAAFRAHELGLKALLIDLDEVLSLLKDWMSPDDKPVDANYGPGGKAVPFPCGGDLIERLVYGDRTPSSQLYNTWRAVYDERGIAASNGVELAGLEVGNDGLLRAKCVQAATRGKPIFTTRAIILAMGRGMPTKLEIPGDTAGINYKVRDAQRFVGKPACVIGGGTSAAEAVIVLSNAKAKSNDNSDVFWSYRKRSLPKVNSTLAKDFFAAFSGNGNIRYLPFSEPVAVLKSSDGNEFIALRSDRRAVESRPTEGTFLEFPKEQVLACIGADLPLQLLESIGIKQFKSADDEETYLAVTPWLETQVKNVFMVGELLSPAFIQTRDFRPEAEQSTVIDHGGNFKRSMLDAVLAVDVIAARKAGKSDDELAGVMERRFAEFKQRHAARGEIPAAKSATAAPPEPPRPQVGSRIVRLQDGQAIEATRETLAPGRYVIGRNNGQITFANDEGVVDNHAAILVEPEACYVSVEDMQGQALVRVAVERTLEAGDVILAGAQRMRIENMAGKSMVAVLGADGETSALLPITEDGRTYGRVLAPRVIAIDKADKSLSRRHFTLEGAGAVVKLRDYGSRNGTYVEVRDSLRLNEGDVVFIGQQGLRFDGMQTAAKSAREEAGAGAIDRTLVDTKRDAKAPLAPSQADVAEKGKPKFDAKSTAKAPAKEAQAGAPAARPAKADDKPAAGGPPALALPALGQTLPIGAEQTVLDRLIEAQLATKEPAGIGGKVQMLYECKSGGCGKCVMKVVGGASNLSKLTGKEKTTLKNIVADLAAAGRELQAEQCRLACKAMVTGPVTLELLGNTEAAEE
jgi:thioredoxin reductase/ferredoxin